MAEREKKSRTSLGSGVRYAQLVFGEFSPCSGGARETKRGIKHLTITWNRTAFGCPRLALFSPAVYSGFAVKQPFVNVEEKIDRFVGRRTQTPDGWRAGMQLQQAAAQFHKTFKHRWMPKGVYRFKTHEEADEWMMKMPARSGLPKT
jgi:hypothetical protein